MEAIAAVRPSPGHSPGIVLAGEPPFRLGALLVEPGRRRLLHDDGREEFVEPRIMQVLVALALADGATLSRDDLSTRCWKGRLVSTDALNRVISRLRALASGIGADSFAIETLNRVGYRLIRNSDVVPASASASASAPAPSPSPTLPMEVRRRSLLIGGAMLAAGLSGAVGMRLWPQAAPTRKTDTIAVMAFDVHDRGQLRERLGTAFAREVRRSLSRIAGLRIISDASSFKLSDASLSPRQIGRRLGADLLVFGTVRRSGDRLWGDVEIVDAASQVQLWAQTASAPIADPGTLGEELSALLTERAVELTSVAASPVPLPPRRRSNPRAYVHVVEAEQAFIDCRNLRTLLRITDAEASAERAVVEARAALAIDPDEVRAWLVLWGLARNGWSQSLRAGKGSHEDLATMSAAYIRRALLADPNDPAALAALGDHYRRYEWRWVEAEALLKRAIAADPGLVEARWAYATLLGTLNRAPEGVEQARELRLLDPENVTRRGYILPRLEYAAGLRSSAIGHYEAFLRAAPADPFMIRELYLTYLGEADAGALRALAARLGDRRRRTSADASRLAASIDRIDAAAAALHGAPKHLVDLLDRQTREIAAESPTDAGRRDSDMLFQAAIEYGWAGRVSRSLDLLEQALASRSLNWVAALPYGIRPFPAAVRDHARFAALWADDPRLSELMRLRGANLVRGAARIIGR